MRTGVVLLVAITALLMAGVGVVVVGTVLPGLGSNGEATPTGLTDTETPAADRPFTLRTDSVEPCGRTCRDVTLTLTNEQPRPATDVTVRLQAFAGRDTAGDPIWQGTERVGRLAPGGSATIRERVRLSVGAALEIRSNDGWITLRTTIETAERTVQFTERRQVD